MYAKQCRVFVENGEKYYVRDKVNKGVKNHNHSK